MALKGKQKKLDKNNNGRIDAEDFKILQGSKKGMRMGGMAGYGSARTSGMGLQDESMKPGKVMKARTGKLAKYERGLDFHPDPLVRSGKMSKGTYDAMDKGLTAAGIVGAGMGATVVGTAVNEARKAKKFSDIRRDYKRSAKLSASEGSFKKGGMLKANSGKLAESMKKLREKAYEKSGKKMKGVGRYGKDEYMIQKKLPGMKTGKYVFDMVGVKPMSGLNKNKKKDGFLDNVFEKTIKKYGLKDPTKKK
jgi:hypothetical protein